MVTATLQFTHSLPPFYGQGGAESEMKQISVTKLEVNNHLFGLCFKLIPESLHYRSPERK